MSRADFVSWAAGEIGPDSHEKRVRYFRSALGRDGTEEELKKAWCGIFALCGLHETGLALDVKWIFGLGFLTKPDRVHWLLPVIKSPLPGDIGYQATPFQHHFVVEAVDGSLVHSVDGNQPDVRRKTRSFGPALTFFSIAPLLALAGASDALPSPSVSARHWSTPAEVQHAVNSLMLAHPLDHQLPLLTVDGIIGPKSVEAIKWAQRWLKVPATGNPDDATCRALGLS